MNDLISFLRNGHPVASMIVGIGLPRNITAFFQLIQGNGHRRRGNIQPCRQLILGTVGISSQMH